MEKRMIDRSIQAVPTRYAGVMFRSALEAKWAAFFDLIGLAWEYEPCTLDGWVPDFLVANDWLAEVKPVPMTSAAIVEEPEIRKAIRSFDTLLLGDGPGDALGIVVCRNGDAVSVRYLVADLNILPPELAIVPAMVPGFDFGLANLWNKMPATAEKWKPATVPDFFLSPQ